MIINNTLRISNRNKDNKQDGFAHVLVLFLVVIAVIFGVLKTYTHIRSGAVKGIGTPVTYYVSLSGNDSNNGTSETTPFKTFAKATSVLSAADTLYIFGGTYSEQLRVTVSGTPEYPINIKPMPNQQVIIDMNNATKPGVELVGTNVYVQLIEVKNAGAVCVNLLGDNTKALGLIAHDCRDHGIYTDAVGVEINGNTVYRSNLINSARNMSGGWGSAIKVRVGGDNIAILNNKIYNNYGEGIAATRGSNIIIKDNVTYDNYAVNIYVDNSYNVVVEKNLAYCTPNSGFEKLDGSAAAAFAIGEEYYSGWGAQINNVTIKNNIAAFCSRGIIYYGPESGVPGGLKNSVIANNTFWNSSTTAVSILYGAAQSNVKITNNIVHQPASKYIWMDNVSGIDIANTYWVNGLPTSDFRGINYKSGDIALATSPAPSLTLDPTVFKLSGVSSAIDAGVSVSGVVTDFFGNSRPQGNVVDIGAHEYGSGGSCTPTAGTWSYGTWSTCTATCGGGTQTRTATCSGATCGGTCSETPTTTQLCNTQECPPVSVDVTPPAIAITSPTNNTAVKRGTSIIITAAASDDVAVAKVEFYVNNTLKCTSVTAPFGCKWTVPSKRNVVYTINAKAYDTANNIATNSVTVKSY